MDSASQRKASGLTMRLAVTRPAHSPAAEVFVRRNFGCVPRTTRVRLTLSG